jgi:hypothetical protein
MAWYYDTQLVKSDGDKPWWKQTYSPGDKVPVSGIYVCINCKKEITSNDNDPFPPQNHHQHEVSTPIKWKLIVRTNTTGV